MTVSIVCQYFRYIDCTDAKAIRQTAPNNVINYSAMFLAFAIIGEAIKNVSPDYMAAIILHTDAINLK